MSASQSKANNFDLLRLFAALQIMLYHYYGEVHLSSHFLNRIIHSSRCFGGLIIIFTISGFLIFSTFDNNPGLKNYFRNRFLRIYPGLWVCVLFTITTLIIFGYINRTNIGSEQFLYWLSTQMFFFQYDQPDMFQGFGTGSPNGSLWTIPVELSFYLFVPFIFTLFKKIRFGRNAWIVLFMALSITYNIYSHQNHNQILSSNFLRLMGLNLVPYLFYFLLGALAYTNWKRISQWYIGKGFFWLAAYLVYYCTFSIWLKRFDITPLWTNTYHFIAVVLLSQTIISLAFSYRRLSTRLLRNNDISFGVYGYHMPVINILVTLGYCRHDYAILIAFFAVLFLASISWIFIERPAQLFKRKLSKDQLAVTSPALKI